MALSAWISSISQLFGLCGLTSIRMFLPAFLYFLVLRAAAEYPKYFPQIVIETSSRVSAWQLSTVFLVVLGILAIAEIVAVRCAEVKKFLTDDFDKFAKPVLTMLVLTGVISPLQQEETKGILEISYQASFLSPKLILVLLGGSVTYFYCRLRCFFFSLIYSIDPDGSLGVQRVVNAGEEIFLMIAFLLIIFAPVIALFLILWGAFLAYFARKIFITFEEKHSHCCAECRKKGNQTLISDCAVICPVCHSKQPEVCELGWLGFATSKRLTDDKIERHIFSLQKSKRCRCCASPLKQNNLCERCGNAQWTPESIAYFKARMRKREICFIGLALLTIAYPLIGFLLFLVLFHAVLIRPYVRYLKASQNFVLKFLFTMIKVILLALMLLLSMLPFVGILALLAFLIRYLLVKRQFYRNIEAVS